MKSLALSEIRLDGGTQTRATLHLNVIDEYAEAYKENTALPSVVVFDDGESKWLADGFHRIEGRRKAGFDDIPVEVHKGTARDALLYAAGSNVSHGLRRSNDDKHQTVKLILADPEWAKASDRWIAEVCHVSHPFVSGVRSSTGNITSSNGKSPDETKRTGKDGKKRSSTQPEKVLCERCKRVGQTQNCAMCAELRTKKPKKKPSTSTTTKTEGDAPTDDYGTDLPKCCRDAFCDPWVQSAFDLLTTTSEQLRKAKLQDSMRKRAKRLPFINDKDFIDGVNFAVDYIDKLWVHLKENRPSGVCPECAGAGCGACKMSGLVPREVYKRLKKEAKEKKYAANA